MKALLLTSDTDDSLFSSIPDNVDDGPASPGRIDDRENLFYEEEPPPKGCWWHFTHFLCGEKQRNFAEG